MIVRAGVIRMGMADEDSLVAALALPRIEPEAELRKVHSGARELNFKCHAVSVGKRRGESNFSANSRL